MKIKESDVVRGSFIGKRVKITKYQKKETSQSGVIMDETRHTFVIETGKGLRRFLKELLVFRCKIQNKEVEIEARRLVGRLADRIKKPR